VLAIKFTKHAENMLKERNFTKNDILSVIENPDWKEEKEEKVWHAFKRSQNKVLRVVVKGKKEPYRLS
jgi:spore maturation protein CgeB